ncbi:3'(2'),5'-bisphosphate nucleotidase CysQ [Methyloligella sp. 2.7D]|uniref:inositol monophosphatase family protein n=1 Tax=unclassified Methyloligella TaxID=2625955 RepID=UPI00157C921B|nr:3'(2'),5'-bisphosphate nucleotidase CysQ [Methyloligella sp. GL2]QKP78338.1 3'(2'),5'-bisphosphate nucleotidase CysQ [Methyloligella sp. GL2]
MTALKQSAETGAPTLQDDLALLKAAVRDSGALALGYFDRHSLQVDKKPDGSEVSEADLAVDAALKRELETPRKDYGWLSEETEDDRSRLSRSHVWVVDPIDGTRAFVRSIPEWTISAALIADGAPVLGAVYNPVTDEFFHAIKGGGAFLNDEPIRVGTDKGLAGARLIASGGLFRKAMWRDPWPEVETRWVNSVAYRLALVAADQAEATISMSPKSEWDVAAAALIVEEAGGAVTDHAGKPFAYNQATPKIPSVIGAPPAIHHAIIERTRQVEI